MPSLARHQWLQRHQLLPYLALAFAISWLGVIAVVGPANFPGTEEDFRRLIAPVVVVMLLGPSAGGIVATALIRGRDGMRDLWRRATAWRIEPRWYLVALFTAPLIAGVALGVLRIFSPAYRAGIATTETPLTHLGLGILTGLAAGFFEEIGWTGFATPILRKRFTTTQTGLILGVIWGAWHTVASWWGSNSAGDVPLAIYLPVVLFAFLIPYRILMVRVYERTQSVLLAMLMHASLTGSLRVLDPIGNVGREVLTFNAALGAACWGVVAVVALRSSDVESRDARHALVV